MAARNNVLTGKQSHTRQHSCTSPSHHCVLISQALGHQCHSSPRLAFQPPRTLTRKPSYAPRSCQRPLTSSSHLQRPLPSEPACRSLRAKPNPFPSALQPQSSGNGCLVFREPVTRRVWCWAKGVQGSQIISFLSVLAVDTLHCLLDKIPQDK